MGNCNKCGKDCNEIKINQFDHSFHLGNVSEGCKRCIKGEKLVLFITGKCAQQCYYCPVSEHKFGHDKIFADEWEIEDNEQGWKNLVKEVKLINAKGAGITGGDPLCVLERTCKYIKRMKEQFGKDFHVHLYTPLKLINKEVLVKLNESGLDEIRFHPDLDDDKLWDKLLLAKDFVWDIGIEIPCVPGKEFEIKKLIDFVAEHDIIKFFNLNELERSDTSVEHYSLPNDQFPTIDQISYAIQGSKELAELFVNHVNEKNYDFTIYFCTAKLKDGTQLTNRLKRRAKSLAKLPYNKLTDEGTLIKGVIYLEELKPGFDYKEKLVQLSSEYKGKLLEKLNEQKDLIEKTIKRTNQIFIDEKKFRLLCSLKILEKNVKKIKKINLIPAIVEEMPTEDAMELEIEFL
ncbi:radical SAM protein [archaeon]|jgi:uncharacterized protein|nr:radical SAM protein [archaeon]MBT3450335.1 radical SAM protein [archaeon]MBT6868890.1 radical SAM protein [archaeon]MBT7192889.1 radical SAM protein [archaeon]MBT7380855.1 radical SAM protein [archaeon]